MDATIDYPRYKAMGRQVFVERSAGLGWLCLGEEGYFAHPGLSASALRRFARDRREFRAVELGEIEQSETEALKIGTGVHAVTLEHLELIDGRLGRYQVAPREVCAKNGARSGNAYHEWAKSIGGARWCVTQDQLDDMRGMAESLRCKIGDWIDQPGAVIEVPVMWTDGPTGMECKCKPDLLVTGAGRLICVDIKTTPDPRPWAFRNSARRLDYGLQAAHYVAGLRATTGAEVEWYWAVVGKAAPYTSAVYGISFACLMDQSERRRSLMDDIVDCRASGDWSNDWESTVEEIEL